MRYQLSWCRLTQDWPRLSRCHRGIILNDDCFYISLHFLCASLTMPLWLIYVLSHSLPLLLYLSLFSLITIPSTETNTHPHTCTTNCVACIAHRSPVIPQADWLHRQRHCFRPCPLPTAAHPVELSEQDPGVCGASQSSSLGPEYIHPHIHLSSLVSIQKQNMDNKLVLIYIWKVLCVAYTRCELIKKEKNTTFDRLPKRNNNLSGKCNKSDKALHPP